MSKKGPQRVVVDGNSQGAINNPFAALDVQGLSLKAAPPPDTDTKAEDRKPVKGVRLDLRRETAGRGGKAVVVIVPADPMMAEELRDLGRKLRQSLGCGGTIKDGHLEIQGDRLPEVRQFLEQTGFRCRQIGG